MSKRVDLNNVPVIVGSGYPAPFDKPCAARARQRLGDIDMRFLRAGAGAFARKDGTPYPPK